MQGYIKPISKFKAKINSGTQPPQTSDHYYAKLSNCPYVLTKIETVQLVPDGRRVIDHGIQ